MKTGADESTQLQKFEGASEGRADVANDALVMTGVEFLLSMVEARWAARNGDGSKGFGERTHQELEKIEQQITRLQERGGAG